MVNRITNKIKTIDEQTFVFEFDDFLRSWMFVCMPRRTLEIIKPFAERIFQ